MPRTAAKLIPLVFFVTTAFTAADAGECLSMKVSPRQALAPVNLRVTVRIEPNADNRVLTIVADSPGFYRSSQIQLEGERAARITTFEFRSLPPGTYEVRANLLGADGRSRAMSRQQVNVIASGTRER